MAYDTFWLAVATMLATFDISKAKDKDGNSILPDPEPVGGLIKYVVSFVLFLKMLIPFFRQPYQTVCL